MAVARDLPYLGCHFQVRWSPGEEPPPGSGFSEVVLPALTADVSDSEGAPIADEHTMGEAALGSAMGADRAAIAGGGGGGGSVAKPDAGGSSLPPLVLRRGFFGSLELYRWWNDTRLGIDKRERTLVVDLLDSERGNVVCTWEFADARPVRLDYSPMQALGASVLIETLTLSYAAMTMK